MLCSILSTLRVPQKRLIIISISYVANLLVEEEKTYFEREKTTQRKPIATDSSDCCVNIYSGRRGLWWSSESPHIARFVMCVVAHGAMMMMRHGTG